MVLFRRHDLIKARLVSTPDHLPCFRQAVHHRALAQHLARIQRKRCSVGKVLQMTPQRLRRTLPVPARL